MIFKLLNKLKCRINKGFSLVEALVGVTIFTLMFISIIICYSTMIRGEIKIKQKIYESVKKTNEISEKYYIKELDF